MQVKIYVEGPQGAGKTQLLDFIETSLTYSENFEVSSSDKTDNSAARNECLVLDVSCLTASGE